MYILRQDITTFLDGLYLNQLTGGVSPIGTNPETPGDDSIWKNQIPFAVGIARGYIARLYDADTEFKPFLDYDNATAYTTGQRLTGAPVNDIYPLYVCIQDAPAGTLLTDTAYFEEKDSRNPVVLQAVCAILIYHISGRLTLSQIPEQYEINYNNAIETLRDIQKAKLSLDLPTYSEEESASLSQRVIYGQFDNFDNEIY